MTNAELIAALSKYPPNFEVVVGARAPGDDAVWGYLAIAQLDDGFCPSEVITIVLGDVESA